MLRKDADLFTHSTDRDWQTLGLVDPYWAVLTDDRFRRDQLTQERIAEFYASGQRYVDLLFSIIARQVQADFRPVTALDFGCGVGRIVIPLAQRCQRVVGVDISEAMLAQARQQAHLLSLRNAEFVQSDDQLSRVSGPYDFVHSYIVLQHIPPSRGLLIVRRLVQLIANGGIGALHVTFGKLNGRRATLTHRLRSQFGSAIDYFRPILHSWFRPKMQMTCYDLNSIVDEIQGVGAQRIHMELSQHGNCLGALMIFRKSPGEPHLI